MVTDLDTRYSALCDVVRAHPDVPADLRAEIRAAAHLAGITYAGGAPPLRGDLGALRRAWDVLARDVALELREATRAAGDLAHRGHAARERRWDAHVSVTDARWDDAMRGTR